MNKTSVSIIFLLFLVAFFSCERGRNDDVLALIDLKNAPKDDLELYKRLKQNPDNLNNNIQLWTKMSRAMRNADLIKHATKVYYRAQNNGLDSLMSFSAAYISQSYLLLNDLDSVQLYLFRVDRQYVEKDLVLKAMVHNVAATYAMKAQLDYSNALKEYMEALEAMEKGGYVDNQVAILCNIANIYFEREDSTGLRYADRAYELSSKYNFQHLNIHTGLVKSQMLYLSQRWNETLELLAITYQKADNLGYTAYLPILNMTYADVYYRIGRPEKARKYYEKALSDKNNIESGSTIQILQHYADFLIHNGECVKSTSLYREALSLSYSTGNIESRNKILLGLSDALFLLGEKEEALSVYRNAHRYQDTLLSKQKDMEFNKLLMKYERIEKNNELEIRDLTLAKTKRASIIIILILLLILGAAMSIIIFIRRRNKMYKLMVEKHQAIFNKNKVIRDMSEESRKTMLKEKVIDTKLVEKLAKSEEENLLNIYLSIERLMKEEKLYREKDISLESIAAKLATNRSYVSKAINAYAENTFYNYINIYRVEEATAILSDITKEIPLKTLADELGYNSISSFYRAFQKETGCPPAKYREQILKSN